MTQGSVDIHPTANIEGDVIIGHGTSIMAFTSIGGMPHIRGILSYDKKVDIGYRNQIGEHCVIKRGAKVGNDNIIMGFVNIGHDVEIGDGCEIGVGVKLLGHSKVGNNVLIKAGAMVRNRVTICDGALIGMRANVTKDITEPGVYYGNPAKRIR